jgi:hypothetical protein
MLPSEMSPTLLELVVALLLVWVAWQLVSFLYPKIIRFLSKSSRMPAPLADPPLSLPERNTKHGHHR